MMITENDFDLTPIINCKYVDINSFKSFKEDKKKFSILHLNIASLSLHKEEFEIVLTLLDFKFDIIGISETKLKKGINPNFDISLIGYNHFSIPTESEKGGVMLYIANEHKCKPRDDLSSTVYKSYELESVFMELIIPNKKNVTVGCIYRHPSMDLTDFTENYLNQLMAKMAGNKNNIFLLGDFNIDLMKNDIDTSTSTFLDLLTSNLFVPHIIHPTRITPNSKTLIDNIFSNSPTFSEGISGNITLSISDHLAQFLIIPMNFGYVPSKIYLYKRDTKNFDRENFLLDLLDIDWSLVIKLEKEDPNYSFNLYENTLNTLLDKYIPLRKITQKELKQQYKPWITNDILKSIKARENLYKKFIKAKDEKSKEDYFKMYKELRNKILTKCRNSKKTYFQNFFFKNANNLKNMWTGINSLINVNNNIKQQPTSLLIKNKLISDHKEVAETFNNYFSSSKLQGKIHHSSSSSFV